MLVGGDDADVVAVEPLLQPFAGQVFHVGPTGAGTVAKLVNNQLFLAAVVLVQEAYVLGAAAGLEPSELHGIIRASSAGPYAALAPLLLGRDFDDVIFRLDIATKDLTLAAETAATHGVDVPVERGRVRGVPRAVDAGLGAEAFHASLVEVERRGRDRAAGAEEAAAVSSSTSPTTRPSAPASLTTTSAGCASTSRCRGTSRPTAPPTARGSGSSAATPT